MRLQHLLWRCALSVALFLLPAATSLHALVVDDHVSVLQVNRDLRYLEDKSAVWRLADVQGKPDDMWKPVTKTSFGQSRSRYWFYLDISSAVKHDLSLTLEIDYAVLDSVYFYEQVADGTFAEYRRGTMFPREAEKLHSLAPAFRFLLPAGKPKRIYIAIQSARSSLYMPARLYAQDAFRAKSNREFLILGGFFGLMVLIFFYALFLWLSTRLREYGYFLAFVLLFAVAALIMTGVGGGYLWASDGWFNRTGLFCVHGLYASALCMFSMHYLALRKSYRNLSRAIYGFIFLDMLICLAVPMGGERVFPAIIGLENIAVASQMVILFVVSLVLALKGNRAATLYLFGWTIFFLGMLGRVLMMQGVLPANTFFEWSYISGPAVGISILSIALADRMNLLQRDKNKAQLEAIENKQRAIDSLMEANRIKDDFLAKTSHELRTPVYAIVGLAENLLDRYADFSDAHVPDAMRAIAETGRKLNVLINDILDYSKLRRSAPQLSLQPVDIRQIIDNSLRLLGPMAAANNLEIEVSIAQDVPPLSADPARLEQILNNLISNAIKYTRSGKITVSVAFSGDARILVADTGIGISKGDLQRVFEPFEQADSGFRRKYGGTGLGLYITRQLVSAHGSTLEVTSEPGVGSEFSFRLPPAADAGVRHNESPSETYQTVDVPVAQALRYAEKPPAHTGKNGSVLVVDDEPLALRVAGDFLQAQGFSVVCAASGAEALELLRCEQEFDVAILDLMMPNMSGFDLCIEIRRMPQRAGLPVLVLSAMLQTAQIMRALEAGANDYLLKPFERAELLFRLHTLLENCRAQQIAAATQEERRMLVEETHRKMFSNMHDHVGSHLVDLKLKVDALRQNRSASPVSAEELSADVDRLVQAFRSGIDHLDDLLKISRDFSIGLQIIALRRYSQSGRLFVYDSDGFPDDVQIPEFLLFEILSIMTEVINNDLKYGSGPSHWKLHFESQRVGVIEMVSTSSFDLASSGVGHGMANIYSRARTISADISSEHKNGKFHFRIQFPLQAQYNTVS